MAVSLTNFLDSGCIVASSLALTAWAAAFNFGSAWTAILGAIGANAFGAAVGALIGGFLIAALGSLICWLQPQSLPVVLTGQVVRSIGMIPATFMGNVLLADALDDVERITGHRCDGFTSSLYNVLLTLSTGLAMFILNTGLSAFRYISPAGLAEIPVQGVAVKSFITFCVVGLPTIVYPLIAFVFHFQKNNPKTGSGQ